MPLINLPDPPMRSDSKSIATMALPAAGANTTGAAIALMATTQNLYLSIELFDVGLTVPATPNLANGQTLTCTLQDSPDGVTYSPIVTEPATVVTGAGGTGGPAVNVRYRIAKDSRLNVQRRYLALNVAASATAGNNTAVSATVQLYS